MDKFLLTLFRNLGLYQRFFKNIAIRLAKRLRELGNTKSKNPYQNLSKETSKEGLKITDRDRSYSTKFNLPEEVVIKGKLF